MTNRANIEFVSYLLKHYIDKTSEYMGKINIPDINDNTDKKQLRQLFNNRNQYKLYDLYEYYEQYPTHLQRKFKMVSQNLLGVISAQINSYDIKRLRVMYQEEQAKYLNYKEELSQNIIAYNNILEQLEDFRVKYNEIFVQEIPKMIQIQKEKLDQVKNKINTIKQTKQNKYNKEETSSSEYEESSESSSESTEKPIKKQQPKKKYIFNKSQFRK